MARDRQPSGPPRVLTLWSRAPLGGLPPPSAARREAIVQSIASTLRNAPAARSPGRRFRTYLASLAAAITALLGCALVWHLRTLSTPAAARVYALAGAVHVLVGGREVSVPQSAWPVVLARQASTARIETERDGVCLVQLADGVVVTEEGDTNLLVPLRPTAEPAVNEVTLERGLVHVHAPPLRAGEVFVVVTPDARAVVHGTAFSVEVIKAAATAVAHTSIVVTEGVVSVQSATRVHLLSAGMSWASPDDPASSDAVTSVSGSDGVAASALSPWPADSPGVAPNGPRALRSRAPAGGPSASARVRTAKAPASNDAVLADENEAFAEAMRVRRSGDAPAAIRLLGEFIERYPAGPLAEDAHVELFRTWAGLGDMAKASQAARRYLAVYPHGFATEEARLLALEPTAPASPP